MATAVGEIGAGTGGEYAEYLLAARRRFAEGHATTVDELRRVYRRAAAAVRQDVASATPGTLRRGHLVALAARLDLRARELNQRVLDAVEKGIRLSVGAGVSGPEKIAGSLLDDAFDAGGVRALFANVNERATVALLARTGRDGLKLSDRVWRIGEHYRNNVRTIIEDAVARGENARVVARKLEQYLQPGVHTALKAETRQRLGVSKDVSMETMRLATTEMSNAFREGTIAAAQATPGYLGVYWRLSGSHALQDVCDDYARHNGNGFWPKGEEPTTPHPWCLCYLTPAVEDSATFKERLREWLRDPGSQPDLERWYNDTARPFLERPAPRLEGLSGGGGLGSSGGGGLGGAGGGVSQHPVDRLIRELISTRRSASRDEVASILRRMAEAEFPTIARHLQERLHEGQWAKGTGENAYLEDLRRAISGTRSRLVVYRRRGGSIAAVLGDTEEAVPEGRRGEDWLPLMYVVFSADRGILLSGYQASAVSRIGIPEGAQWLK